MSIDDPGAPPGGGDPRLDPEFVRAICGDEIGTITLVGVVHDHPASAFRTRAVVESRTPDVLALEIPHVALPLYEAYAEDDRDPTGGPDEFTAAIRAASAARVVGIDAPNLQFVAALARKCVEERLPLSTVRDVMGGFARASREATACRMAAAITANTAATVQVGERVGHPCTPGDGPAMQADDEVRQVDHVRGVEAALGRPPSVRVRDEVREECMARALSDLRREGDVVAVVGLDHLDSLADALRGKHHA